jgi:D-alanyl-D-alanine carboxypeptidase/D-alanyl-D-alanine-endopeptidase (penicillin-binding protein 4)
MALRLAWRRAVIVVAASAALGVSSHAQQAPRSSPAPATAPRPQNAIRTLATDIRALTAMPGVQRGLWGIAAYSLTRRQPLFELNAQALFVPASTAKLLSAASAYEAVGWDYRFETSLWATGPVVGGTLQGDLVIVGNGDPSFDSRGWAGVEDWAVALAELGLRRIDGRIIGDDDALEEPRPALAWAWDDLGYSSGVLFGALNTAENRLLVTVSPAAQAGLPAVLSVEPHAAHRPLVSRALTSGPDTPQLLWPEQRPAETALTISGSIPVGAKPVRLLVSAGNPTRWFAGVVRHHLVQRGIQVTGEAVDIDDAALDPRRDYPTRLFTHRSPPLRDLVRPLLKESVNLYGEALMRLNSGPGVLPTNDAGLDGLNRRLTSWGIAPGAQQIVDGSGLSRRNALSPEALLAVLQRMYDPTGESPFMQALPVAGVDGSLGARLRDTAAARNLRAKTGTMSNIRTLAGYVTTRDKEDVALVVMVNNFEGTSAEAVAAIDAIAVRLAEFTRR